MKDGSIFLDRDGDIFKILMNMLRSEGSLMPKNLDPYTRELLDAELKYWKIEPSKLQLEYKLPLKLLDLLNSEPKMDSNKSLKPLQKWREVGPLDLMELNKHSPIDFS